MFLLVPAYPGCPGSKAVKRSLLLLLLFLGGMRGGAKVTIEPHRHEGMCTVLYHSPYYELIILCSYLIWKGICVSSPAHYLFTAVCFCVRCCQATE